jgi:DNA replication protein DnaC
MPASSRPGCRDPDKRLDTFDFDFNKKMHRRLIFELATGHFVAQHADGLFLGPPGTEKRHLAQAVGFAVIQQGHRVCYREAHVFLDELSRTPSSLAPAKTTCATSPPSPPWSSTIAA